MIKYIDEVEIMNKKVLVRVDYNLSLTRDGIINDDTRIVNSLPTLKLLLKNNNKLILMSHLGKPKGREMQFSLRPVAVRLQEYLKDYKVTLVDDFLTQKELLTAQTEETVLLLENTRFYEGEKKNDPVFSQQLASLAEIYVDDAFGSAHRAHASTVGVTSFLPSYGGLLLKKELAMIKHVFEAPVRPIIAIIGGKKISSKIGLIAKFMESVDAILIGGAMANNFLKATGLPIGKGLIEEEYIPEAKRLLDLAAEKNKHILLPIDRRIGLQTDGQVEVKKVEDIGIEDETLDIGPATEELYTKNILGAKTIIWNGPVGFFENPLFAQGSRAIYRAIVTNSSATSLLGGGDTLSFIKNLPDKDKITYISTGGGAMLELIEKGTLPGIEALEKATIRA